MNRHIFISYAPPDRAIAETVCAELEAAGLACWIEPRDVHGAESRDEAIEEAAAVAIIFSKAANFSRQVRDDTADAAEVGVPMVPFCVEPAEATGALRLRLSDAAWIEGVPPPLEAHYGALIEELARHVPDAPTVRPVVAAPVRESDSAGVPEPPEPLPIEPVPETRAGWRRSPAVWATAGGAVLLLLLVLGLTLGGVLRRPANQEAATAPPPQVAANAPAPANQPTNETQGATQTAPPAPTSGAAPGPTTPAPSPSAAAPAATAPAAPQPPTMGSTEPGPFANLPPLTTAEMPAAPVRVLSGDSQPVDALAFGPSGRVLVSGSDDRKVRLWDVAHGRETESLAAADGVAAVAYAPRGGLIAWSSGRAAAEPGAAPLVWLWDAVHRRALAPLLADAAAREAQSPRTLAFSPDGKLLATGSDDGMMSVWDVAGRRVLQSWIAHPKGVTSVAFSPDGRRLASGGADGTVRLWDTQTGDAVQTMTGHARWVRAVAFSPDGRLLASASEDRTIRLWDAGSGHAERVLKAHGRWVRSIAFAPDSHTLASAGQDGVVRLWDVQSGRELRTLSGHSGPVLAVVFAPEGEVLASAGTDQTIRLWNLNSIEAAGR